jgi:glyoxylase-like metal-dependent hydrolase (beta-lactamase superfamily II)
MPVSLSGRRESSGDLLYEKMPPNLKFTGDPGTWSRSLRILQDLKPRAVVPGHGPLAGPESLDRQASFLEGLPHRLLAIRNTGMTDPGTIAQTLGLSMGSVEKLLERLHHS